MHKIETLMYRLKNFIYMHLQSLCLSAPDSRFHILMLPGLLVLLLLIILPIAFYQMSIKRKRSLPKVLVSHCVIVALGIS